MKKEIRHGSVEQPFQELHCYLARRARQYAPNVFSRATPELMVEFVTVDPLAVFLLREAMLRYADVRRVDKASADPHPLHKSSKFWASCRVHYYAYPGYGGWQAKGHCRVVLGLILNSDHVPCSRRTAHELLCERDLEGTVAKLPARPPD